ncbi:MAG: pirin family protein [Bauldia litoralis]
MHTHRLSEQRGRADLGWLDSRHTFSFGHYYDPAQMGFGALRVINEDTVVPGAGFDSHGHQDMEIITYVLEGALEHKDSMGNGSVIRPGDVQRMTAGTGVRHSEYNQSQDAPVHFLQIWVLPEENDLEPGYEQIRFGREALQGRLRLIGSRDGREGSITIHQDVALYASLLDEGDSVHVEVREGRQAWIQLARGELTVGGADLRAGDGLGVTEIGDLEILARQDAEFLVFDLSK